MTTCFDCAYYTDKMYCSNPASAAHKTYLNLDPVIDEYGELPEEELCAIGWAKLCDVFVDNNKTYYKDRELTYSEF